MAGLAGVSVRTLHHYDAIGLVRPSARTPAGYRACAAADVERLREVLAYRRLGFGLREIAELVGDPSTDAVAHLRRLRGLLLERRDRADAMVAAIDGELTARAKGLRVAPEEQLEMLGARLYDAIGGAYTATRRTEPRIAAQIWAALGDAQTVLNVGAGTGSYEPADRDVTAVEPSAVMREQRPAGAAPCVAAAAESLPFGDRSFDVAMAVSAVHHWGDPLAGLREMRRVARRVVVLTFDTDEAGWQDRFWLTRDYLPEFATVLADFPRLPGWPARAVPASRPCLSRGTAPTGCSRRTGAGRRRTRRIVCGVRCRCGREWVRRPNSGRYGGSARTSPPAGGPSGTVSSPAWTRRTWACACSSPEPSRPGSRGKADRPGELRPVPRPSPGRSRVPAGEPAPWCGARGAVCAVVAASA